MLFLLPRTLRQWAEDSSRISRSLHSACFPVSAWGRHRCACSIRGLRAPSSQKCTIQCQRIRPLVMQSFARFMFFSGLSIGLFQQTPAIFPIFWSGNLSVESKISIIAVFYQKAGQLSVVPLFTPSIWCTFRIQEFFAHFQRALA